MNILLGDIVVSLQGAGFVQESEHSVYPVFVTEAPPDLCVDLHVGREPIGSWVESRVLGAAVVDGRTRLRVERTEGSLDLPLSCDRAELRLRGPWPRALDSLLSTLVQVAALLLERGLVLHASAVTRGGRALVFTGRSGAGKSTAAASGARANWRTVAEDMTYVALPDGSAPEVRPLPFWQRGGTLTSPERLPVDRVCYLRKAAEDRVWTLTDGQGVRRLLETVSVGVRDPVTMTAAAAAAVRLAQSAPVVDLDFTRACTFWPLMH